jgi:hypothetical protein
MLSRGTSLSRLAFAFVHAIRRHSILRKELDGDLSREDCVALGTHIALWSMALDVDPHATTIVGLGLFCQLDAERAVEMLPDISRAIEARIGAVEGEGRVPLLAERVEAIVRVIAHDSDLIAAAVCERKEATRSLVDSAKKPEGGEAVVEAVSRFCDLFIERGRAEDFEPFVSVLIDAMQKAGHTLRVPEAQALVAQAKQAVSGAKGGVDS